MRRNIISCIIVLLLLLSGCQNNTPGTTTDPTNTDDTLQFDAEKNAQNKYVMLQGGGFDFQETDGFFIGKTTFSDYLQYYDKASGISGVLCADPSCAHDSESCGAYTDENRSSLSYYDGKLYRVDGDGSDFRKEYLWQSDLSGMNRKKIMEIPRDEITMPYQPQQFMIHQGKLYIVGSASVVDGTQIGTRQSLLSRSLSGDEGFTTVYDEVCPEGSWVTYRFVGGYIYISVITSKDLTSFDLIVTKVDIQTNASKVVYQETGMPKAPGKLWVTEDHGLYLSGSTDEKAYLWKIENGSKREITSWPADEVKDPVVMDGIAMLMTRDENKIRYIDIRDFEGKTIYSGKLFTEEIAGLGKDPNTYSIGIVGGDEEKLILELEGEEGTKMDSKSMGYFILLDLKDNMKATILCSSEE